MPIAYIDVYLDASDPTKILRDLNGNTALPMSFFQGSNVSLRVYIARPTGAVTGARYAKVDISALSLQVAIGPRAGAEAIKAAQYTWTKQISPDSAGLSGYFYADIDLNTTDLNTAIGTSESYESYLEFRISESGASYRVITQAKFTLQSVVKDPGSASSTPTPSSSYLTRDECLELFVLWDNRNRSGNAGRNVVLVSPDGAHTRTIGVDNDGAGIDYAI